MTREQYAGHFRESLALLILLAAACGKGFSRAPRPPDQRTERGAVTVPTQGLPSQFAWSSCDSVRTVTCFRDTAYVHALNHDPGLTIEAEWIWFGAAGDSVEIAGRADSAQLGTTSISTNEGQEYDAANTTAPYLRRRLVGDGVVTVLVTACCMFDDTVAYTLSVRRVNRAPSPALRPSGKWAKLRLVTGREEDQFSVIPLSVARSARDRSNWKVFARTYKVALVADSLYEVCRLPCSSPETVKLTPNADVTRRY
jgi:hypothetical protein